MHGSFRAVMPRVAGTTTVWQIMVGLVAKAAGATETCASSEMDIHIMMRHVPAQRAAPWEPGGRHPNNEW